MSQRKSIDVLVAEIGSTTTVINAFDGVEGSDPVFLGQGQARTTVEEGGVGVGVDLALTSSGATCWPRAPRREGSA